MAPRAGRQDTASSGRAGAVDLVTLGFTYFAVGVTVSVVATSAGTPEWVTIVGAVLTYSATGELAYLAASTAGGSLFAAVTSGMLVSSRFGLLAGSLAPRFRGGALRRAVAAALVVDPSVALAIGEPDDEAATSAYWRATAFLAAGWWLGTVAGVVLGNVIGDPRSWGLDAVFPASLLAIVWRSLGRLDGLVAGLGGAVVCLALLPFVPAGLPALAAALMAVVALTVPARPLRVAPGGRS